MADAAATIHALAAHAEVCVVHGAGPQITAEMQRHHLPVRFVGGRRVTTPAGLAIVRRALVGANRSLCAALGERAIALIGDEIGLEATRIPELGLVGDPLPSRPPAVEDALARGTIPVVAPLAAGELEGGIVPKLRAAVTAARLGVHAEIGETAVLA